MNDIIKAIEDAQLKSATSDFNCASSIALIISKMHS